MSTRPDRPNILIFMVDQVQADVVLPGHPCLMPNARRLAAQGITFTRSRPYRKNDSCFVEQKNWSVVRRFAGYGRHDTDGEVRLLNRLYGVLRLYTNFFLPVVKLTEKVRQGSKVTKKYDAPQTPYQRVLASPEVSAKIKTKLRAQYAQLDVVVLHQQIERLVKQLWTSGRRLA